MPEKRLLAVDHPADAVGPERIVHEKRERLAIISANRLLQRGQKGANLTFVQASNFDGTSLAWPRYWEKKEEE